MGQEQLEAVVSSQEEAPAVRSGQEQPRAARRSQERARAAEGGEEQPGATGSIPGVLSRRGPARGMNDDQRIDKRKE